VREERKAMLLRNVQSRGIALEPTLLMLKKIWKVFTLHQVDFKTVILWNVLKIRNP